MKSYSLRSIPCLIVLVFCVLSIVSSFSTPALQSTSSAATTRRFSQPPQGSADLDSKSYIDPRKVQAQILAEMKRDDDQLTRQKNRDKFAVRRNALVVDTAYFGFFIFCGLWTFFPNPFVAISYLLGSTLGLAYAYGLGKYVENFGDPGATPSGPGGGGETRFAFFILLFILVGKFRSQGLLEIPSIAGFFTYQLASLNQGFRQINDD